MSDFITIAIAAARKAALVGEVSTARTREVVVAVPDRGRAVGAGRGTDVGSDAAGARRGGARSRVHHGTRGRGAGVLGSGEGNRPPSPSTGPAGAGTARHELARDGPALPRGRGGHERVGREAEGGP